MRRCWRWLLCGKWPFWKKITETDLRYYHLVCSRTKGSLEPQEKVVVDRSEKGEKYSFSAAVEVDVLTIHP